jgi:hypothetical protein
MRGDDASDAEAFRDHAGRDGAFGSALPGFRVTQTAHRRRPT